MRVVVVGAGVSGLGMSLLLADGGHDVVLLERDATPLPDNADDAFEWQRRGAPQVRHSHAFLARGRNLLRDRLPQVRRALLDAGVGEVAWGDMIPETMEDPAPRPGDEDLVMLACRRTTFEWVLRSIVSDRLRLDHGRTVTGFLEERNGAQPKITGVRTSDGDMPADIVIDATGRPGHLLKMLCEIGVDVEEDKSETGIVYLSRFYRLHDGVTEPNNMPFNGGDLGYLKFAVFRGDNRTLSVTMAYAPHDRALRSLNEPGRFDQACQLIPAIKEWVDPDVSAPISDVHYMGGLINRKRHFARDGEPLVLGLHAIGDASVCTNPLYGRGCSLGLVQGALLADAIDKHGDDGRAVALELDEATTRELDPWYLASVAADKTAQKVIEGRELNDFEKYMRDLMLEGALPAATTNATVSRAWWRSFNLLTIPNALLTDPEIMKAVMEAYEKRGERQPPQARGPDREEFLAALDA
jgi:flavin-dependent dehydrogenase